jgi:hypothetical protein
LLIVPLLLTLLLAQAAPATLQAQVGPGLAVVGQIGGVANVTAVSGGFLYMNVGPRIARMALPGELPTLPPSYSPVLAGVVRDFKLANGFVYAALGAGGVAVLDGTTLALLGRAYLPANIDEARAVAVASQRLYLADGASGIVAYTLSADKKTLTWAQTKTFVPAETILDVETALLTRNGVTTENLFATSNNSNPARPGSIFRFNLTASPVLGTAASTAGRLGVNGLTATDHFVYGASDTRFFALDSFSLGTSISQSVSLLDAGYQVSVDAGETTAYVAQHSLGLSILDITLINNTTNVPVVLTSTLTIDSANGIAATSGVTETSLYIADGRAGLSIAELEVPTRTVVSLDNRSFFAPAPANTTLAAGTDAQAFAYSNGVDLWTIDTSTPANLSVVGFGQQPPADLLLGMGVVTGTSLFMSAGNNVILNYQLVPGSEPTGGTTVDNPDLNDYVYQTVVTGTDALLADGFNGLATVDVTDPAAMDVTARVTSTLDSDYTNVAVLGNFAYVLDSMDRVSTGLTQTLRVYDVSDMANPSEQGAGTDVTTLCNGGGAVDLQAVGDHWLLLACGPDGVQVVNVSTLLRVGGYVTAGNARNLAVSGANVYVAEDTAGVEWLSLNTTTGALNTAAPTGPTAVPGSASQVTVSANGNVYVASEDAGLVVLNSALMQFMWLPVIVR